ncbi:hypothetical protein ACF061_20305 [Streptomyces sp. NPDC015220]|uniref:hypothetical protein n=1 Tax=Streptomyces sp. NPDC015220 TaxID=3364947 RepID=UPI0036F4E5DF
MSMKASASDHGRIVMSAGDTTVYEAPAPYGLTSWSADLPVLAPERARSHPSLLLRTNNAVVRFTGREAELESLRRWRDDVSLPVVAVRLVHGPGGQGKSRLAAQVARLWSADGWSVLIAHHRRDQPAPAARSAGPTAGARGTLVVVDYAERWDTADLLSLLKDLLVPGGGPVRVLLLARSPGHWWQGLQYPITYRMEVPADAQELGPLAQHPVGRIDLFTAARDSFAEQLGVPEPEAVAAPPALMRHEAYRLVLSVHMAALTAVLAHLDGTTAPTEPTEVSAYLLARERYFWQELYNGPGRLVPTDPGTMARAVYTATLTGPLPHRVGVRALHRIGMRSADPDQVLTSHTVCYPPSAAGMVLEPLYPDRLGEDFLALSTPLPARTHESDPWADEAMAKLLSEAPEDPASPWIRPALTVMIETARRWPHIAERLCRALRERPWLAVRGGNGVLTALAELDFLDSDLLEGIDAHLPVGPSLELDVGIAAFARRLTEDRLARTDDAAARAWLRTLLGARLASADLHLQAVVEYREAIAIYRGLDQADFSVDQAGGLLTALGGLGNSQAALGRYEDALTNTTAAVRAHRVWAGIDPAAHGPTLVRLLTNQGGQLWALGRHQEAVEVAEEAVGTCRSLREGPVPHAAEAALGAALGNLGMMYAQTGRPEEALTATAESVDVQRRLAEADPAAHRPGLAESLHKYAAVREVLRTDTGRAATAAAEATETYTELAAVRRDRYTEAVRSSREVQEDLDDTSFPAELRRTALRRGVRHISVSSVGAYALAAAVLVHRAEQYLAEGDFAQGRDLLTQAVERYRDLAGNDPDAYRHELGNALHLTSIAEAALEDFEPALAHSAEATELIRLCVRADAVTPPALAAVLVANASMRLAAGAELPAALDAAMEAVELYQELAERAPATYGRDLVAAYHVLVGVLRGLGDHPRADRISRALDGLGQGES